MARALFDRLMNHAAPLQKGESYVSMHSIPTRPARDGADPATGRHPRERAQ